MSEVSTPGYKYAMSQTPLTLHSSLLQDDCNHEGNNWTPGYGDFRFRTYYGGSAFFLQRYTSDGDQVAIPSPISAYPPGSGAVADDLGSCDVGIRSVAELLVSIYQRHSLTKHPSVSQTACIMRSATDGFHNDGYNFNFSTRSNELSSDQATALGWLGDIPSARGFFNIPICDLTSEALLAQTTSRLK